MLALTFSRSQQLAALLGLALMMFCNLLQAQVPAPAAPTAATQKLRVVGGLAGLNQYTRNEEPFWTKVLPRLSAGKYGADIVPFDRAGVPGPEMLRLIQLGVVPFGTALLSNVSSQYPEYAAPDLAGLNPDIATLKKTVAAFRPYLEKTLRERHGVEVLAIYTYPAQVVFCNKPLTSLADLAGRRVRIASVTQSDFVAALGGIPVLLGFAQILPNMASGNTECAITGSMSGNTLGLHEVTTHVHRLPFSWGLAIFGANEAAWTDLPGDLRALLAHEIPKLETAIWLESERETAEGFACNRGHASCSVGRKGKLTEVAVSAQDERLRREILTSTVLPRWIQRCNNRCSDVWNQTIGNVMGIRVPASK
jgi:TRAP-type C4-dicarboxylate transport system substrate-binding protein